MAVLADRVDLDIGSIKDYMVYTAKVGELVSHYTWASVLLCNQEYRRRQAAVHFHWDEHSQHLSTVILKEKSMTPGQTPPKQCTATSLGLHRRGKEICLQHNTGKCSYGGKCNFEYVCTVCLQAHPQCDLRMLQTPAKQD